jgi:hypothetical protein
LEAPAGKLAVVVAGAVILGVTSKVPVARLLLLFALLAVMRISVSDATSGAKYKPLLETWPILADQTTPESLLLVTVAVNCCRDPETNVPVAGERLIATCCDSSCRD